MRGSFIAAAFLSAATLSAGSAQTAPARGPAGKQPSAQIAAPQDKAMLELGDTLTKVRSELRALRERTAGAGQGEGDREPVDERPPHY